MKLIHKLLDYSKPWSLPHVALFTGNEIIRGDGALVMGRGAARQVRDLYPAVAYNMAAVIKREPKRRVLFVPIDNHDESPNFQFIGWFQVKYHWRDQADLWLISESVKVLTRLANNHADRTFHMNYPGIGNGKLTESNVSGLLTPLPNNVFIYKN